MSKVEVMDETAEGRSKQKMSSDSKNEDELLNSMVILLGCVNQGQVEACSISLVQEKLRKLNEEAYMPQVVTIGPLHKGTRTSLLYMEEIKLCCVKNLFRRAQFKVVVEENKIEKECLTNCIRAMVTIDEIVRASYLDAVKFNRADLAKIMVIDGCFLLELLISSSPKLNGELKCRFKDLEQPKSNEQLKCSSSRGPRVLEREEVLSDLALLENQIPLVVLVTLFDVLFPKSADNGAATESADNGAATESADNGAATQSADDDAATQSADDDATTKLIKDYALSIFGCSANQGSGKKLQAFHFLQLVHEFMDKEKVKDYKIQDTKIPIEDGQVAYGTLKLKRCATRLEAAGITIKMTENTKARFDLRIKFDNGTLEIQQLHITKTTEAKWRNFIAWEVNRSSLEKHQARKEAEKTKCQFICYAWFIQSLVCSVHDVKLLQERKVIKVQDVKGDKGEEKKIMSDEDVLNLFRKMTKEVSDAEIKKDPWFVEEIVKLNAHSTTVDRARKITRIMWHILRCLVTLIWVWCRDAFRTLRRDYIPTGWKLIAVLAAAAGLALTATQTHYSIHPR